MNKVKQYKTPDACYRQAPVRRETISELEHRNNLPDLEYYGKELNVIYVPHSENGKKAIAQ